MLTAAVADRAAAAQRRLLVFPIRTPYVSGATPLAPM
jgi:hypothetical protein